jgi:general secretion pathway protein D
MKINLDVSNIVKTVETASGVAYQIGTRNTQTSIRLKDGETQVMAGLISDGNRTTASKVPGLGQVPGLGRLFSSNNGNGTKSEIVFSITPHIIRAQATPDANFADVWSGTEAIVKEKQLRLDPIAAARAGAKVDLPGLTDGGRTGAAEATPQPKAGGAGGSSILNSARPGFVGGAPAEATPAAAGAPANPPSEGAISSGASSGGAGSSTSAPAPRVGRPGYAPPSVQPGRAMQPSAPAAPAGTPAPPPPTPTTAAEG